MPHKYTTLFRKKYSEVYFLFFLAIAHSFLNMNTMNRLREIRRHNLQLVLSSLGGHGAQKKLSDKLGIYSSHISNIQRGRDEIGESMARRIETVMGLSSGWMDQPHAAMNEDAPNADPPDPTPEAAVLDARLMTLWKQLSVERQRLALDLLDDLVLAERYRQQSASRT